MRAGFPAILLLILAGCSGVPAEDTIPAGDDAATPTVDHSPGQPVAPTPGEGVDEDPAWAWFSATAHAQEDGALELWFDLAQPSECTMFTAAHHSTDASRDDGPYFGYLGPGDWMWDDGPTWRAVGYDSIRATSGPTGTVDPGSTVWQTLVEAAGPDAQTFTSWLGRPGYVLAPGQHGLRVWMNGGLVDEGRDETQGGSLHAAVGCSRPATHITARTDDEPAWFDVYRAGDETGVGTGFAGVHQGSRSFTTVGNGTLLQVWSCYSRGTLEAHGVVTGTHAWEVEPRAFDPCEKTVFEGAAGALELAWDMVGADDGLTVEVTSWAGLAAVQDEPHAWPWE